MRGGKRVGDGGHLAAPFVSKAYWLRLMAGTVLAGGWTLAAGPVLVQAQTWTGTTSSDYNTATNWTSPSTVPTGGLTATFTNNAAPTSVNVSATVTPGGFTYDAGAPTYTVTAPSIAASIAFVGAGIINNSGNTQNLVSSGGGTIQFEGSATVGNATLTANNGSFIQFFNTSSGGISQIVLNTGGTLAVQKSSGDLSIGSLSGNGQVLFSNESGGAATQSLTVGSLNTSTTFAGSIQDLDAVGSLTKVGTGTLTLSGTSTYTGTTTVNAGGLTITGSLGTAGSHTSLLTNNGTVTVGNTGTLWATNITNNGTLTNNGTVHDDLNNNGTVNNNGSFNGNVATNTGTINNNNGGTWTGNVLTNAGTINNKQGATWIGNANNTAGTLTNSGTWTGGITNASAFTNTQTGTVSAGLNNSGAASNDGTINGGVTNSGLFGNSGTVNGGLTNTAGMTANTGTINGGASVSGGTLTNNNLVVGTVAISGTGTVNNNATITGAVNNAATFNNNAAGTVSGGLTNTGTVNANGGAINGAIANNAGTFNVNGTVTSNSTFTNAFGATLAVNGGGNYTVSGPVTNGGAVTVASNGTLTANAGIANTGTITNSGRVNAGVNNTGAAALITNAPTGTWNGNLLSNTGGATVSNAGTWNGDANNTSIVTNSGTWTTTSAGFANSGTLTTTGTLDATKGGLTNTGTVNAAGGAVNGAITNGAGGHFNVTGTVTSNGTFNNSTVTSALVVTDTGKYSLVGPLTNAGTVTVGTGTGGSLTVTDGITNTSVIIVAAKATVAASLSNSGGLVNSAGTWTGDVNNTGMVVNSGTWTTTSAGFTNSGALVTTGGLLDATKGGLTNTGTVNANGGAINGAITNGAGGNFVVTGTVTSSGTFNNSTDTSLLIVTDTGKYSLVGPLTTAGTVQVGMGTGGSLSVTDGITNRGTIAVIANATVTASLSNSGGVNNAGTWNGDANNSGTVVNSGTWTTASAGFGNSGTLVTTGTLDATNGGFANTGTVNAAGTVKGAITNAGGFLVTGTLVGNSTFTNNSGGKLEVDANSFTGITTLTNANNGIISLAGGTIGDITATNSGLVVATGVSTITGAFNNQATGIVDLAQGPAAITNQLKTGSFNAQSGSAVDVRFDCSTATCQAGLLTAKGTSGTTTVNFFNLTQGTQVVLGGAVTVIKDSTGTGTLNPTGITEHFGLVDMSVQSDGHGGAALVRSLNVGAAAAPGASVMAALSAIDTSFHQSTAPFVASPQSEDPNKWTGGVWSRATSGQTTTKLTAFESFGGSSAPLRVKTNFDAYEVGVDTGMLNFGGGGWNGHFGIMAGAVMATANEALSGSGTSVKFDVPFAGVYGVVTHGPFFMDLEYRHDWVDTKVTNVTANLNNTQLKGHGDSVSGSAGYHFDLVNNWFIEPTAGFGLTQTQFDTLATNVGQSALGFAAGTVRFDSVFSMLVHGGARIGTSFIVGDTLALQPFGTLSAWRELGGQSSATFANGGVSDPLSLSRVGTFYQAGLGLSGQLLNTGFIGFVRGDLRWGDNLNGTSVVGGLRYTFGP